MQQLASTSSEVTVGMQASILRELINQLNIPIEEFERSAESTFSIEERENAALKIGAELGEINKIFQEEVKNFSEVEPISLDSEVGPSGTSPLLSTFFNTDTTNSDSNNVLPREIGEDIATPQQIQQVVIPLVIDRLRNYGVPNKDDTEKQIVTYKGEEYVAVVKVEDELQTLKLDKIMLELESTSEILLASKDNTSDQYKIIINNLSRDEFERFKNLFDEQQSKQPVRLNSTEKNVTNEIS